VAIAPALRGRAVVLTRLSQPTPVSAAVIEELVDLLFEGGCDDVLVAAALSIGDRDRGHHSVQALAHTAGLTGRSRRGRPYEVVDLGASIAAATVPDTSVLAGRRVSSAWVEADVRVVLARSVTSSALRRSAALLCPPHPENAATARTAREAEARQRVT